MNPTKSPARTGQSDGTARNFRKESQELPLAESILNDIPMTVVVAEPVALLCGMLRAHIGTLFTAQVHAARNCLQLLEAVEQWKPDLVILNPAIVKPGSASISDIHSNDRNHEPQSYSQEKLMSRLCELSPSTRVLILTESTHLHEHRQLLLHGASGLVLKEQPVESLVQAIESVRKGEVWIGRTAMADVMADVWQQ
ncbi:MAG TPA: hypothetical protein VF719_08330, partial [Abditibacteriaceae bacterium]